MTALDVCELIAKSYAVVYAEPEEIGLVPTDKLDEYNDLVKRIFR